MKFLFLGLLLCSSSVFAEGRLALPPVDLRPGKVVEGSLFSIKIVPGAKETSFYFVGKEAAKIKLDSLKLQLIVDPEGTKKVFSLKRKKDAFIYDQKLSSEAQLEIQTEDGRVDQLRLKAVP